MGQDLKKHLPKGMFTVKFCNGKALVVRNSLLRISHFEAPRTRMGLRKGSWRNFLMAILHVPKIGKSFCFAGAHLMPFKKGAKRRVQEAKIIVQKLRKRSQGLPIVLGGDMNQSKKNKSSPVQILMRGLDLKDAHSGTGRGKTTVYGVQFDYALVSRSFGVSNQIRPDQKGYPAFKPKKVRFWHNKNKWSYAPSDHFPVQCTLSLAPNRGQKRKHPA